MIHGGYLLSMESTCGMRVGEVVSNWRLIDPDAEITCLNCKNVLMTPFEREQRSAARRWLRSNEENDRRHARILARGRRAASPKFTHAERLDRAVNG